MTQKLKTKPNNDEDEDDNANGDDNDDANHSGYSRVITFLGAEYMTRTWQHEAMMEPPQPQSIGQQRDYVSQAWQPQGLSEMSPGWDSAQCQLHLCDCHKYARHCCRVG